ncbi:MAG: nucleotidyltransferase domain-containing protein [Saprospiraceae bacterium]|nr:nucleotidyltransferase domain-containing protein [Saprospiraceae bacterium]
MNDFYALALGQALNWITEQYEPIGIIVSGSIIRGNPDKNSDFDIYVIHNQHFRQRVQKYFNDVPCEIFVNNLDHIYSYFDSELKNNRPVTANILSTGVIYMGAENQEIITLLDDAKKYARLSKPLTEQELLIRRYTLANLLEDVTDLLEVKEETTLHYIMSKIVLEAIEFTFAKNQHPLPRIKERIPLLQEIEPTIGNLVAQYYAAITIDEEYHAVKQLVFTLTGETGFFEWESVPN